VKLTIDGTRLNDALARGIADGGNLRDELRLLGGYVLTSYSDAAVFLEFLEQYLDRPLPITEKEDQAYRELVGLFQSVLDSDAFLLLARRGIPLLFKGYDSRLTVAEDREGDLLLTLKIFARYGTEEGLDRVVAGTTHPTLVDGYHWPGIFQQLRDNDPILPNLIRRLSRPLPNGFARVAFLDWANRLARTGVITKHPFNSVVGIAQLGVWLASQQEDDYSFAHSAAAAIPFVAEPTQTELLQRAMSHAEISVQMEGAWASIRLGNDRGRACLIQHCLDYNWSVAACRYLEELGLPEVIPHQALDPDFRAMSKICEWLSQSPRFGRPPDHIELLETRELHWPPTKDWRRVWLYRYSYHEDEDMDSDTEAPMAEGIGMSGTVTNCLFDETEVGMSPGDVYALHCCWELTMKQDPRAPREPSIAFGRQLLNSAPQEPPDVLEDFPFDSFAWESPPPEDVPSDDVSQGEIHPDHA